MGIKRIDINEIVNINIYVEDFLPTSESQTRPADYLGLMIDYKMKPIIGQTVLGGPASIANIEANDIVLSIDNLRVNYASDIRKSISAIPNSNVSIKILRDNLVIDLPVSVGSMLNDLGEEIGVLGVSFGTKRSLAQAFSKGVYETYNLSIKTLQFIGKMLTGNMGAENLSGPIGIAQMAGNTAQAGLLPFMYLMALLSISLGVLNLLPIPVLDGGQLTLLGIEAVRGKPLSEKTENFIYTGGAVLVGALMIFAIFNDISRFF